MNKDELINHGMAIAVHAAATPHRVALVSEHGDRTWAELNGRANQLVRALRRRGLPAGDAMYYTSGTTGRPKGVYRRQRAGPSRTLAAAQRSGYTTDSVHLCTGPLYHAAPLGISLAVPLGAGASVVLMDGWDAEETLRL